MYMKLSRRTYGILLIVLVIIYFSFLHEPVKETFISLFSGPEDLEGEGNGGTSTRSTKNIDGSQGAIFKKSKYADLVKPPRPIIYEMRGFVNPGSLNSVTKKRVNNVNQNTFASNPTRLEPTKYNAGEIIKNVSNNRGISQNEKSSLNTAFNKGVFENMDSTYYSPLDDTTGMFTETNTKFYTNCNANLVSA